MIAISACAFSVTKFEPQLRMAPRFLVFEIISVRKKEPALFPE